MSFKLEVQLLIIDVNSLNNCYRTELTFLHKFSLSEINLKLFSKTNDKKHLTLMKLILAIK